MSPVSLSIGKRILLGFVAASLIVAALGAYALRQIGSVRDMTDLIVTRDVGVLRQLDDLGNVARNMGLVRRNAVIAVLTQGQGQSAQARQDDFLGSWRQNVAELDRLLATITGEVKEFQSGALSAERVVAWGRLATVMTETAEAFRAVRIASEQQLRAVDGRDIATVEGKNEEVNRLHDGLLRSIANARTALDGVIGAGQRSVSEIYRNSILSVAITVAASVLLSILVTVLISRAVVRPLEDVMRFVAQIGEGDLTGRLNRTGNDEIGRLGDTLNRMVAGLSDLARTNRAATADLNAAAAEIRASAQEQAASVEEQFAAVQETAATVDEITHSGAQISKRATEVIATAQAAAQTARSGLRAATDTAKAMESIREQGEAVAGNIVALSEKTQAIGEIIVTVNDISERTHLLALNAAIEAAAAGESGRSFAIVASEMKLLADQAKGATAQVRGILGEIQRGINASVMLTEEAVKRAAAGKNRTDSTVRTIEEMAARVEEGVQTFQQIVASTNQQQLGIEQVMGALQNIRQASQQTAAGTREVETASANLTELAQGLMALAERYRL
ncbi:MAG TPA: methyl-accepting chemotaxis protein [Methylobacterium sp.]|jgi:methyl-accepting chemotaxis protein|uniref:methyl-accepting chemotaxis protein n=1 Tax=Methylorubrum sp. B1-46 TaxID=2897334 RepID=UPI001E52BA59|nr:methyl-accepting chemotaxis protein [Methylorubrum sp. B1-46]UGB24108.1 methyl-accepting chemotaxis protein [Methylorubrum sp. B1-46]HEV2541680.1 methyl-accepting chemotaxis protein [Methylobacterium sp.]